MNGFTQLDMPNTPKWAVYTSTRSQHPGPSPSRVFCTMECWETLAKFIEATHNTILHTPRPHLLSPSGSPGLFDTFPPACWSPGFISTVSCSLRAWVYSIVRQPCYQLHLPSDGDKRVASPSAISVVFIEASPNRSLTEAGVVLHNLFTGTQIPPGPREP
ncbi:hypothetical protein BGY98DRAFT_434294 [Russula aff. rugulosa BPL654]|nr:hypothetical protein BGY98DRAFT_434294 [Russula aff. rugulosa BPL654]